MVNENENIFKTSDTPIAAYLVISGAEHLNTDISEFPAIFNFRNPKDGSIEKLLANWEDGRTQGDIKAFFKTYRRLVKEAKKAKKPNSIYD